MFARAKATWRTLWADVVGPEPDVPIPPELQPPQFWVFNIGRALKKPTVWDALYAQEEMWVLEEAGVPSLSVPHGLSLARVVQLWHDTSTPEDVELLERVRHARSRSLYWRTEMEVRRNHLRMNDEVAAMVPFGR